QLPQERRLCFRLNLKRFSGSGHDAAPLNLSVFNKIRNPFETRVSGAWRAAMDMEPSQRSVSPPDSRTASGRHVTAAYAVASLTATIISSRRTISRSAA
ncbi:MAG: hypothetical protein JJT95_18235, partial [Pararhodobacter sp.]|nr:hypothetical protein [Pararhodobacter sp.]